MAISVQMPALGESVTEGTVTRWLKQEGDRVEVDEPLLEVSTDKVDTEIPSPAAGILSRLGVAQHQTADVGSELAVIAGEGEAPAAGAPPSDAEVTGAAEASKPEPSPEPTAPSLPAAAPPPPAPSPDAPPTSHA